MQDKKKTVLAKDGNYKQEGLYVLPVPYYKKRILQLKVNMATILQIMNADRNLSLFSHGLKVAELEATLNETGPFTILGPVNLAIGSLSPLTYKELLEPANRSRLLGFLSGYIIIGKKMMTSFRNEQRLASLNGDFVTVSVRNEEVFINESRILSRDRQGSNGVIHVLDKTYAVPKAG